MKKLMLLATLLFSMNANALIGSNTVKIIDVTNPVGADIEAPIQDVSERGGYSIHCILTGSLQLTGSIYLSNQPPAPPASQTFTLLSGSDQVIDNNGLLYDVVITNAGYVKFTIGTFSGVGTAKCYITTKDI
jgi:hypothetical protein